MKELIYTKHLLASPEQGGGTLDPSERTPSLPKDIDADT